MFNSKKKEEEREDEVLQKEAAEVAEQAKKEEEERPAQPAAENVITDEERIEFEEYKRQKKLLEIKRLLKMIDHTLLRQTATREEIKTLCEQAKEHGFYSVCVQPVYVAECFRNLSLIHI